MGADLEHGELVALLALCLLLAACAAPGPQPESPLWAVSPLPTRATPGRVHLPLVSRGGWTLHGYAMDAVADWRTADWQAEAAEASLWHVWWYGPGMKGLPACRSLAECGALNPATVARYSAHRYILIGNEFNNEDTAGGGWPETPSAAAAYLKANAPAWRAQGFQIVCCNLYLGPRNYTAETWWAAFKRAGGMAHVDVCGAHIFGQSRADAVAVKRRIDAMCGAMPKAITESGWGAEVGRFVQGINERGYVFALSLWSAKP